MAAEMQKRGHCQCCGHDQAVQRGAIAKHGYTVRHGWFEGVCNGHAFAPLEQTRDHADAICRDVLAECDALEQRAARLEQRLENPEKVVTDRMAPGSRERLTVEWAQASEYQQERYRAEVVRGLRYRVRCGRDFVKFLGDLAGHVHGQPLREVERPRPLVHLDGGRFGAACASSRSGARRLLNRTADRAAVTCPRCLERSWYPTTASAAAAGGPT